jgi:DNA-binding NarL/FixJ family response regulator
VRSPDHEQLSSREVEVLSLVARGTANKEVARSLRLSEATVKSHLLHIFEKLGASDRTHAVTIAVQRGILRLE